MQQIVALAWRQVWAGLLGSFSFALVVSVTEYIRSGGVSGLTSVVAVLVGGVVGLAVGRIVMGKPPQPERRLSPRSPEELMRLTEGLTQIEAKAATIHHLGTWLKVQGTVSEVSEIFGKVRVNIRYLMPLDMDTEVTYFPHRDIEAAFDKPWFGSVITLRIGDQVTVIGKIDSIYSTGICLKGCELVDVQT